MRTKIGKGQSGIDMLMTYGWVVVVGIGAIILVSQTGVFDPVPCDKVRVGFSEMIPVDWAVYSDSNVAVLSLENWAGNNVDVSSVDLYLGDVLCNYSGGFSMTPGESAVIVLSCMDEPNILDRYALDSCYVADVSITYTDAVTGVSDVSKGRVRWQIEEGEAPSTTSTTTTTTTTSTTTTSTTTTLDDPPEVMLISPPDGAVI